MGVDRLTPQTSHLILIQNWGAWIGDSLRIYHWHPGNYEVGKLLGQSGLIWQKERRAMC